MLLSVWTLYAFNEGMQTEGENFVEGGEVVFSGGLAEQILPLKPQVSLLSSERLPSPRIHISQAF